MGGSTSVTNWNYSPYSYDSYNPYDPYSFGGNMNPTMQRVQDGMMNQYKRNMSNSDALFAGQYDESIAPLIDAVGEYRPLFGRRTLNPNDVSEIFNSLVDQDPNKALALYVQYCAEKGGLKNPSLPATFSNLQDPSLLIRENRSLGSWLGAGTNATINSFVEIANKTNNSELSAVLLKHFFDGLGKNSEEINKILVAHGNKAHTVEIAKAYENIFGERIDKRIQAEYSPVGHRNGAVGGIITGAAAGALIGNLPGAIVGGILGGISGALLGETSVFGANKEGNKLLDTLNEARLSTNNITDPMVAMNYGFGYGGYGMGVPPMPVPPMTGTI